MAMTKKDEQRAREAFAELFPDQPIVGIDYCPGGYRHSNFRIDTPTGRFAVRLPSSDNAIADPNEARWLEEWSQELSPELLHWSIEGLMVTRWCPWIPVSQREPNLSACLALLARLRELPLDEAMPAHNLAERVHADLDAAGAPQPAWRALANTHPLPPELTVCHNDLNPDNLLYQLDHDQAGRTKRWCVLDWEWAGLNWPGFDAATLYGGLAAPRFSFAELTPTLTQDERRLALRWFALREYGFALAAIAGGNDHPALANQRDRYELALGIAR